MAIGGIWFEDPLGFLLGDDKARTFLSSTYERDALVVEAEDRSRFDGLISIDAVDAIVTGTDLKRGDLLLADASRENGVAEDRYIDDNGYVDRGAVAMQYRAGATVILNQAQRMVPALGQLCQGLEYVFSSHIQTNLYLTPPHAKGFPTHFDNHDVFVIQAEGEKLWRLYDMPVEIPYRGERFQSSIHGKGELRQEFVLRRGDCAYVPRGLMHDAETSGDEASLHITVGLISRTWADLILEAVSEVAVRRPEFRRSLPAGFALPGFDRTAALETLKELGQILAGEMRLDPAMDLLVDNFIKTRPAQNRAAISEGYRQIGATDRFVRAPLVPVRRARDGDRIAMMVPGDEIFFTLDCAQALDVAFSATPFTLTDLGFEHAEPLVRRLLSYGLICRAA